MDLFIQDVELVDDVTTSFINVRIRDQKQFLTLVKDAASVTAKTDATPVLQCIKIEIKKEVPKREGNGIVMVPGNALFITGSNSILSLTNGVAAEEGNQKSIMNADRPTSFLVSANSFAGMLSKMPKGDLILEIPDQPDGNLTMRAGTAKYEFPILDVAEYPVTQLDELDYMTVDSGVFSRLLKTMLHAVAKEESASEILKGVHLFTVESQLKFEASNRRQGATAIMDISTPTKANVILSGDSIKAITDVFDKIEGSVKLGFGENQFSIAGSGRQIISRVIDGEFPLLSKVLPSTYECEVTINQEELMGALDRTIQLTKTGEKSKKALRIHTKDNEIHFKSQGALGNGGEYLVVDEMIGSIEIGIDAEITKSTVQCYSEHETIRIKFSGRLHALEEGKSA